MTNTKQLTNGDKLLLLFFRFASIITIPTRYIFYILEKPVLKKKYQDYSYFEWWMLRVMRVDMRK